MTIGLELASTGTEYARFDSKVSLLDWDIVLFKPEIDDFINYADEFQGKPSLSDRASFQLRESCEHWRREINEAVETGKTVIIFLSRLQEVYVDTGERSYSGTGRNQRVTHHVAKYSNYHSIPAVLGPVAATGKSMKLSTRGAEILAPYWAEFESASQYEVILTNSEVPACIVTGTGDRTVGALYRSKSSAGTLLLLPDIDFYSDNLVKEKGNKEGWTWSRDAEQFARRMLSTIVALDRALRTGSEVTPEPDWAADPRFVLAPESILRIRLLETEQEVEEAQQRKEQLAQELRLAGAYRGLLYEKGKPLENVIIAALRLLGFSAEPYKESDSEFDVVFVSDEGRLIGEAEGKDDKAVNIDKLRQLLMNIQEDLQRESVTEPAKPVLFGNGFRLQPLDERSDPFTQKCHRAAAASSTALVFTPDLFWPVHYLIRNFDAAYARACRQVLLSSTGRVAFPTPVAAEQVQDQTQIEELEVTATP